MDNSDSDDFDVDDDGDGDGDDDDDDDDDDDNDDGDSTAEDDDNKFDLEAVFSISEDCSTTASHSINNLIRSSWRGSIDAGFSSVFLGINLLVINSMVRRRSRFLCSAL